MKFDWSVLCYLVSGIHFLTALPKFKHMLSLPIALLLLKAKAGSPSQSQEKLLLKIPAKEKGRSHRRSSTS